MPQYSDSRAFSVAPLSNCTLELSHLALSGVREIFRPGYQYKRVGVTLDELALATTAPLHLFADDRYELLHRLMVALDFCNARFGVGALRVGLFPSSALWRTRVGHPAPGYMTRWGDVMVAE